MDRVRAYVRRELVFLALGTMDVCVITPLFAALLSPIVPARPLHIILILLGAVLAIHYLARLSLQIPIRPTLRSGLLGLGMLTSGLLIVHQTLHAETQLLNSAWLADVAKSLRRKVFSQDIGLFLSVLFLWWRGLVLAQRRLDSESVAFRFRLGVILLAVTTGIGSSVRSWPYPRLVFLFFFASLLGIALARAEEVGHQYGGRQSPFNLGWLATLVTASLIVLLLAAGLASLLTGENLGRVFGPVVYVLEFVLFALVYVLAWGAQFVIEPLLALLSRYEVGSILEEVLEQLTPPQPPVPEMQSREPLLTPEQQATIRMFGAIGGALLVLVLVAFTLYRLRAKAGGPTDEERESVWEGVHLRPTLENLLQRGRHRLDDVTGALVRSRLGQLFAALTVRRIYAHMAALAADQGYPRALDETPYDYMPALEEAFPDSQEEVARITESYVAVHYGELPERAEDLTAVRTAWEQIRERASMRARILHG